MKDIVVVASCNEVDNFPKVERYIKKNNLTSKVIYGVKVLMLINEIKVPVIILVRNQVGLKNLYKIISLIKTKNKKQVISKEEMVSYSEGLLYGLNVLDMDFVYKEISDEDIMNDMMWYDFIFIDEKKNLLNKQEYLKKMILLARKRRKIVFNFNTDEEFRDDRDKIVSLIESVKIIKDNVYFPKIKNSKDVFIKEIEEGLHRLYGKEIPLVVLKRINEELYGKNKKGGIINSENESIYLIYKELVLKSKQLGYTVIPRGYVASSFVAYLIGITNINPLVSHYHCLNCSYSEFNDEKGIPYFSRYAYGVLMPDKKCHKCKKLMKQDGFNFSYEMFLGSEATFKPNININFALEIKNDLIHYLEEKLGKNKVLYGGVIGEKNNKKVWGIHPGSIFLVPKDLDIFDFTPVAYPCDDVNNHLITYLDYREVRKHLMPFNILGHPIIEKIKKLEEETKILANSIPLNDKEIFEFFSSGQTDGFCSFSKVSARKLLKERKPSNIEELIDILGMVYDEGNDFKEILFREDLYHYLSLKMPFNLAYEITKFISKGSAREKEDVWLEYQNIMKECEIDENFILNCSKIGYLVSKAHCVSYAIVDIQLAWYKIKFPKIFQKIMSE